MGIIEFLTDSKKLHQALFLLPLLTFYLTKSSMWFFFGALIILAIMEGYKADLDGKIKVMIKNRINQKSKNKPLLRDFNDQMKDIKKEFNYIFALNFFIVISIIFIVEFIYSTVISFSYSKILFGIHLFLIVYFLILDLMIDNNFKLLAKRKGRLRWKNK